MEETPDIFAGLNDFCANFNPDHITYPANPESHKSGESSDSEAEKFFATTKPKSKTRKARTTTKNQSPAKDQENNEISLSKRSTKTQSLDIDSEYNDDNVSDGPMTRQTRRRRNGQTATTASSSIEAYMQRQTAAVLALENIEHPRQNQRGRARRRYMAEVANRGTVSSVVDLAGPKTPPLPPRSDIKSLKGVISLDSDDEGDLSFGSSAVNGILDSSFDLENAELSVKINWGEKIDCVPHRKHQKFIDLLQHFAKEKEVDYRDIILHLNERIIQPDDTPYSIEYNIGQFIYGSVVPGSYAPAAKKKDPNVINVKIQSDKFKKPLKVPIRKNERFKILYIRCAEELKISCDRIKLSFDGEALILTETPADLDLEGGEVIDCNINN